MSLRTQSLTHTYPMGIVAVKDISVQIDAGELVAIMGENGAGKTTLVKHFNGLLKPSKGLVLIDGVDTRRVHVAKLSRRVGMVFQNPDHQIFEGSVFREIAFGIQHFNVYKIQMKKRVEEVAGRVGLAELLDQPPFSLSIGDRKRVALASILAWNPDIIILDEPTVGQDALLKASLKLLIKDLHEEGKTVIMISHDVEFVTELEPRVVLMRRGEIIADGSAASILTNPSLIAASSLVLPQVTQILAGFDGKSHSVLDVEGAVRLIRNGGAGAS